jgi:hypothetical protein
MRVFNEAQFYHETTDATGGTETLYTETLDLAHSLGYSLHYVVTKASGTVGGTIITQKSNDNVTWYDVTTKNLTDATQQDSIEVTDVFHRYLRVKVTLTGGVSTTNIAATTKGV